MGRAFGGIDHNLLTPPHMLEWKRAGALGPPPARAEGPSVAGATTAASRWPPSRCTKGFRFDRCLCVLFPLPFRATRRGAPLTAAAPVS